MSQPRLLSLAEAIANVVAGWLLAFAAQIILFPVVGIEASLTQHLNLSTAFTALSLARSYILRRLFDGLGRTDRSEDLSCRAR